MKIVVGSRGSNLALTQTNWVIDALKKFNPHIEFELKIIKTKGDIIQNVALDKIGDKGLFTKEIEVALLNKEIDIAVHSMKDMPSVCVEGLKFSYIPKRENYNDVLILKHPYKSLDDLPIGAKIGTGSKRRKYQLLAYRSDLNILPIRGNIDTRMRKIEDENLDGVVLAAAGVHRLNMKDKISYYIPSDIVLPAPAQGILAIQVRENDKEIEDIISVIHDENTKLQCDAERAFLEGVNGGCHIPIGALAHIKEDEITLEGLLGDEEGNILIKEEVKGNINQARDLGLQLASKVLNCMKNSKELV